jgi:(p)ppGpp synthase/HD superfamily hydrolase
MTTETTEPSLRWTRLAEAAAFAFALHADQRRKGTTIPYIAHLMSVAALVLEHGGDEEQAIAGLLHDAIEDMGAEQEDIIKKAVRTWRGRHCPCLHRCRRNPETPVARAEKTIYRAP